MRYFVRFSYKGKNYHGWQIQPNVISIQQVWNDVLSKLTQEDIYVVGSGRTDAGVHARIMYLHFDTSKNLDLDLYKFKSNIMLPKDIAVYKFYRVIEKAHARFDAYSRSYEYHISLEKNPFLDGLVWQYKGKRLMMNKMNKAAEFLLEYDNLKCFSRSKTDVKNYNCDVTKAKWEKNQETLVFYISANRFLRNMVRSIVGTLIQVGLGKCSLDDFVKIIESKDRSQAGISAPGEGLYLTEVKYPNHLFL